MGKSQELDTSILIKNLGLDLDDNDILSNDRKISGGETARIGVARALADPKEIIILDEHTAGLNDELAYNITKQILDLEKTVICVSHTESEDIIALFDYVININDFQNL